MIKLLNDLYNSRSSLERLIRSQKSTIVLVEQSVVIDETYITKKDRLETLRGMILNYQDKLRVVMAQISYYENYLLNLKLPIYDLGLAFLTIVSLLSNEKYVCYENLKVVSKEFHSYSSPIKPIGLILKDATQYCGVIMAERVAKRIVNSKVGATPTIDLGQKRYETIADDYFDIVLYKSDSEIARMEKKLYIRTEEGIVFNYNLSNFEYLYIFIDIVAQSMISKEQQSLDRSELIQMAVDFVRVQQDFNKEKEKQLKYEKRPLGSGPYKEIVNE